MDDFTKKKIKLLGYMFVAAGLIVFIAALMITCAMATI